MFKRKKPSLQGKAVIVTGASRGLGSVIARLFYDEGAQVVLTARNEELLQSLSRELDGASYYVCDLRDKERVKGLVYYTVSNLGRVDVLINNAGIGGRKPFVDQSLDEVDKIIDVNLKGLLYTTHYAVPHMIKNQGGIIVNISSMAGLKGTPGITVYSASKFGVVGFTKSLAKELKKYNIKVHCVCPEAIDTDIHRSKNKSRKLLNPVNVAKKVLELVVEENKTGKCIKMSTPRGIYETLLSAVNKRADNSR